jgi:hypothetical protein
MARGVPIVKITVDGAEVDAKKCTKCGEVKALTDYSLDKRSSDGATSSCKECRRHHKKAAYARDRTRSLAYAKEYYAKNRQKVLHYHKDYTLRNKEKVACYHRGYFTDNRREILKQQRKYYKENPGIFRISRLRRRSKVFLLPSFGEILKEVEPICALTESLDNVHIDHFIPIATGHGGDYPANLSGLRGDLNISKNASNPFEWFEANRQRFELDQSRFDSLVAKLAEQNGLTSEEFREYTDWCFANPRNPPQIKRDNERYGYRVTSVELWREATGRSSETGNRLNDAV